MSGRSGLAWAVSTAALSVAICLPSTASAACSLRCNSIAPKPPTDFDIRGIELTNWRIHSEIRQRDVGDLTFRSAAFGFSFVPVAGPLFEKAYSRAADLVVDEKNRQIARLVEADVKQRIRSGESAQSVQDNFQANARATVDQLVGPHSAYPEIAGDTEAYNRLQDAAIQYVADKLDAVIRDAKKGKLDLQALKAEVVANAKGLHQVEEKLQAEGQALGQVGVDADDAKDAMQGAVTASAKAEAANAKLRAQAAELSRRADLAAGQLDAAATLLRNLHVDKNLADNVATAGKVAHVLAGIGASYGNPYAILPTLAAASSLFGGGDSDPAMGQILAELSEINRKLDALREEVANYHRKQMESLYQVQTGIVGLLGTIYEAEDRGLRVCQYAMVTLHANGVEYEPHAVWAWNQQPGESSFNGILLNPRDFWPTNMGDVDAAWQTRSPQIKTCLSSLDQFYSLVGLPARFAVVDLMNQVQAGQTDIPQNTIQSGQSYHAQYAASLQFKAWIDGLRPIIAQSVKVADRGGKPRSALDWALSIPAADLDQLDDKADVEATARKALSDPTLTAARRDEFDSWSGRAMEAEFASRAASYALLAGWWREFIRPGDKLLGSSEVDLASANPEVVVLQLRRATDALRIATAQQASVAGDALLPIFYAAIVGASRPAVLGSPPPFIHGMPGPQPWVPWFIADQWWLGATQNLEALLATNSIARSNLGLYYARQRLRRSGKTLLQYQFAYADTTSPLLLSEALGGDSGQLVREDGGWSLRRTYKKPTGELASYTIPLPKPVALREGKLHPTASLVVALTMRLQTDQELAVYEFKPRDATEAQDAVRTARLRALKY